MNKPLLIFGLTVLALSSCQPVASPEATQPLPTSVPLTGATTPVAYTPTPTPTLPASTATATPLPPIPTADFSLTDIAGIWTRSDPERGDLFIILHESGAYIAAHGSPAGVIHSGKFSLEGSLLTFRDGWNCQPLPNDTPGHYVVRRGGAGRFLFFDLYKDPCPDRLSALRSFRWTRFISPESTPTP